MPDPITFKYRAFISYSHRDKSWGQWLHRKLEGYAIGRDLVGRQGRFGPIPKSLRPIFRDREDFSAAASLAENIQEALRQSQFLVVVCSPAAAKSPYVNEEVRQFKALGREDRILAMIIDGDPGRSEIDCFPPALRFRLDNRSQVSRTPAEPIAADARAVGDGPDLARLKIVAGLLGVGLDEIRRREAIAQRRRMAILGTTAAALFGLSLATGILAFVAERRRVAAELNLEAARVATNSLVFDIAGGLRDVSGMQTGTLRKILGHTQDVFEKLTEGGSVDPDLRNSQGVMFLEFAKTYAAQGDPDSQLAAATRAQQIFEDILRADPGNTIAQRNAALALQAVAAAQAALGDGAKATAARAAAKQRVAVQAADEPEGTLALGDKATLETDEADRLRAEGHSDAALEHYRAALAITQRLLEKVPQDMVYRNNLATLNGRVADALKSQGHLNEALVAYKESLRLNRLLVAEDPTSILFQGNLKVAVDRVADALVLQRDWSGAAVFFREGLGIAEVLANSDHGNGPLQFGLAMSHERLGDVLGAQQDLRGAETHYKARLDIVSALTRAHPENATWQHDLTVAHDRIADVAKAREQWGAALAEYGVGLEIGRRLLARDPQNRELAQGVAVSLSQIAQIHQNLDHPRDAYVPLREAVEIRQKNADADSSNTEWLFHLAVGYGQLGQVTFNLGHIDESYAYLERSRKIAVGLIARDTFRSDFKELLRGIDGTLAQNNAALGRRR